MLRASNNLLGRPLLHNLPIFHDVEILGHVCQHGNIVGHH